MVLVLLTSLNCCMSTLRLVHYALLLTPAWWKSNNTNARLMAFAPSLALDPTFGIHSHKTLDTAQPCQPIGVTLPDNAIDRSHRVGKVTAGGVNRDRPILVKFTSYKYKEAMMKARRGLNKIDATKIFPDSQWPALPARSTARVHRLYINEDLTRTRAEVAARARQLKRDGKLDDTWTRDGIIFVKKGDSVHRITTVREIHVFN